MIISAPKGTKDILPREIYKWQYLERMFQEICSRYGFKEIRTPVFEHTEVFSRGVGDTTDIVQKEMYTFMDYGKRSITLRPEGTSGIVRAFIEHKQYAESQPTKLAYEMSCFRYEKPQSGRQRAFHQFGVEIFGSPNMLADSEVISIGKDFLEELGITNVQLRINSIGCSTCRPVHREALKEFLKPNLDNLCATCQDRYTRNPMRILDCKSPKCQEIVKDAPVMMDYLCDECEDAFSQLKENLNSLEIEFVIDPKIVRGLDYYTKTAFEFVSNEIGAQGTVCGGGRYDNLIEQLGGPALPGVGFGMGIERLLLTMEACGAQIPMPDSVDVFIIAIGSEAKGTALKYLKELRKEGFKAEIDINERNVKGQFKYADKIGAKYTIILGEEELKNNRITLKDMEKSEQRETDINQFINELKGK